MELGRAAQLVVHLHHIDQIAVESILGCLVKSGDDVDCVLE